MYQETRVPRLRAALWASTPDEVSDVGSGADSEAVSGPASAVPGTVAPEPSLIVPDGCMDLIVIDSTVVIAGADSTARVFRGSGARTVGLRFDPGVLPQLLATSAAELADQVTPLDAVISPGRMVGSAASERAAARTLLHLAASLTDRAVIDTRPLVMAEHLGVRGDGAPMSVAEVASEFAYSPRQLRRLSAEWFGYGPKHLAKVLRWQAARSLIDAGQTRTSAASEAGYADAAHLWRDERSLLGQQRGR